MAIAFAAISEDPRGAQGDDLRGPADARRPGSTCCRGQRAFLRDFTTLSRLLRPGVRDLRISLPTLNSAIDVGTPVLRAHAAHERATCATSSRELKQLVEQPTTKLTLQRLDGDVRRGDAARGAGRARRRPSATTGTTGSRSSRAHLRAGPVRLHAARRRPDLPARRARARDRPPAPLDAHPLPGEVADAARRLLGPPGQRPRVLADRRRPAASSSPTSCRSCTATPTARRARRAPAPTARRARLGYPLGQLPGPRPEPEQPRHRRLRPARHRAARRRSSASRTAPRIFATPESRTRATMRPGQQQAPPEPRRRPDRARDHRDRVPARVHQAAAVVRRLRGQGRVHVRRRTSAPTRPVRIAGVKVGKVTERRAARRRRRGARPRRPRTRTPRRRRPAAIPSRASRPRS